jgi:hypothetical protein
VIEDVVAALEQTDACAASLPIGLQIVAPLKPDKRCTEAGCCISAAGR